MSGILVRPSLGEVLWTRTWNGESRACGLATVSGFVNELFDYIDTETLERIDPSLAYLAEVHETFFDADKSVELGVCLRVVPGPGEGE